MAPVTSTKVYASVLGFHPLFKYQFLLANDTYIYIYIYLYSRTAWTATVRPVPESFP